ncbi:MAG TPA: hypothetical protein ENH22_00640 [Candidatus Campbellbacteria bacterium]|nr:hypothetical protein [Candidatus Campbellbacteria bacterium]
MSLILILLSLLSATGMVVIVIRRLPEARALPKNEFFEEFNSTKPVFADFRDFVIIPLERFWNDKALVFIYKKAEKGVSEINLYVKKIENKLLKARDYIHGKNFPKESGRESEYWNGVNEFKNGLPHDGESEEDLNEK